MALLKADNYFKDVVQDVADKAGVRKPDISAQDFDPAEFMNAYSNETVEGPRKTMVAFGSGMEVIPREYLTGIVAHELGHLEHRDSTVNADRPRRDKELGADKWAAEHGFGQPLIGAFEWEIGMGLMDRDSAVQGYPSMGERIQRIKDAMKAKEAHA